MDEQVRSREFSEKVKCLDTQREMARQAALKVRALHDELQVAMQALKEATSAIGEDAKA